MWGKWPVLERPALFFQEKLFMEKKKYSTGTMILLMLLGFRLFGQMEMLMTSPGALIMFLIYLSALIGVFMKKRWGAAMGGLVGGIDLAMSLLLTGGANRIGAVVIDLAIIYLSYKNYREVTPLVPMASPVTTPE